LIDYIIRRSARALNGDLLQTIATRRAMAGRITVNMQCNPGNYIACCIDTHRSRLESKFNGCSQRIA
jgi:hypothetical protein